MNTFFVYDHRGLAVDTFSLKTNAGAVRRAKRLWPTAVKLHKYVGDGWKVDKVKPLVINL